MNIKIEFKGKLHKLATGLTSLEDIHKDILARYSPKYFASGIVLGYINNNAVTRINSFEELLDLAKNQQGSLKLKAFEAKEFEVNKIQGWGNESQNKTEAYEVVDLSKPEPTLEVPAKATEQPEEKIQNYVRKSSFKENDKSRAPNTEEHKQKNLVELEKLPSIPLTEKSYSCVFCKGVGLITDKAICQVCGGSKVITHDHPLIGFIDEIVADRLTILLEKQKLKSQEKPQKKSKIVFDFTKQWQEDAIKPHSFAFIETPISKVFEKCGKPFLWNLRLINNGISHWPERVFVYRIQKGIHSQVFEVPSIKSGEQIDVAINFVASKQKTVQLFDLRLGYVNKSQEVVFFGQKFGFEVDTLEKQPVEKLTDANESLKEQVIDACKFVRHQKHPIDYLVTRIKEITLGSDLSLELLVDIITTLQ